MFCHKSLCKTSDLEDGAILTKGYDLNNRGKNLLAEATYQISNGWVFQFSDKNIFKVFP